MKKIVLLYCFFFIFSIYSLECQDITTGLIAWWSFDDSTANDHSGNGHNGQLMNTPSPVSGKFGTAFRLQGRGVNTTDGDHILLPPIDFNNMSEFTVSIWVWEEGFSEYGPSEGYIWWGDWNGGWLGMHHHCQQQPFIDYKKQYIRFSVGAQGLESDCFNQPFDSTDMFKWVLYSLTYKNGLLSCYKNDSLLGSKLQNVHVAGGEGAIGRHWWNYGTETSTRLIGMVDDARVYNRALKKDDLKKLLTKFDITARTHYLCEGDTLTIFASEGFDNYKWSTGEISKSIVVSKAGQYSVIASMTSGDSATGVYDVYLYDKPNPKITVLKNLCRGKSGKISVSGNYKSILWSNSKKTKSIDVNTSGIYSVTVIDSNGCTGTAEINIDESNPAKINISLTGGPKYCIGDSVEISADNGLLNYEWFELNEGNIAQNQIKIKVTISGKYYVRAFTADSCETGSDTVSIAYYSKPVPVINIDLQPCNGRPGKLSLMGNYSSFRWSTNETTKMISAPKTGKYSVTVVDSNGCTGYTEALVKENYISVKVSGKIPICEGDSVTLTADNGFVNYQWFLNNTDMGLPANQNTIKVVKAGRYFVKAATADSCLALSDNFDVYYFPQTIPLINIIQQPCKGKPGILTLSGNFISRLWSTNDTTSSITVTKAGKYSITVIDSNGCTGFAEIQVDEIIPEKVKITVDGKTNPCYGDTVILSADDNLVSYLWYMTSNATPYQTGKITNVSMSGNYFYTAFTKEGCLVFSDTVNIQFSSGQHQIEVLSEMQDGYLVFDTTYYGNIMHRNIKLKNITQLDIVITTISLKSNIEFSVPLSQFPMYFAGGEIKDLVVYLSPKKLGKILDTLLIYDNCNWDLVPLKAFCSETQYQSESNCNVNINLRSQQTPKGTFIIVGAPYPNPAGSMIFVPFSKSSSKTEKINASLINIFGSVVASGAVKPETFAKNQNLSQESGNIIIDTSNLDSGVFLIVVNAGNETITYPIIVQK